MPLNSTPRIMIVESFGNNIKSLSSHLQDLALPLQILAATDATTAMARLQIEPADLLIIDAYLRGNMDGFDLCRAIKSSTSDHHPPIILLLAGYLSLERSKGMSAGADLLLHRPVVKEELLKMIQLLLGWRLNQAASPRPVAPENHALRRLRPVV